MDQQIQQIDKKPDFIRIYNDIIKKYPDKMKVCDHLLKKTNLSSFEIIQLNTLIFGEDDNKADAFNKNHRCYEKCDVIYILEEQKRRKLNNTQVAKYYGISRNTIAKWKKSFLNKK
ncbi:helix-turn-helix domain-containing protein [Chryseobacterium sp. SIMBA_028]|uniref:helix-turn-helix domain-containing protein n=1 Tax=Chryseobacterium sp. SIMBA_028 TaxID=3085771 RepID=UPI00397B0D74